MSVGLLIISHDRIGQDLIHTASSMLGTPPLATEHLAVSQSDDPDQLHQRARKICDHLDTGQGVLILTDMYGSTPSNIATRLMSNPQWQVIAGVNLPMLVRILNYPQLSLHELVNKALSGGHDGILLCEPSD